MLEKIGLPAKPSLRGNNWVVDASHCQGCSSQFTFINRKHHCRRCGGIFCSSCTQQRMFLRGQGDSAVRICDACKKLEEAARFEMRHGYKNRAGKGSSKLTSKHEDEVLGHILGTDANGSSSSESLVLEIAIHDGREIQHEKKSASPEELRQRALEEKKKYKILKAEGKSAEALKAFKRGKELERQAEALELSIRRNRKKALSSSNVADIQSEDGVIESSKRHKSLPQVGKEKDDFASELRELGWTDDEDKKPAGLSLEGELSSLLGEVTRTSNKERSSGTDNSQVVAHKKKALMLKREGKLAEAKEELKKAKVLERQLEDQALLAGAEDSSDDEISALIRSMDDDKDDDVLVQYDQAHDFDVGNLVGAADDLVHGGFEVTDEDMGDPKLAAALKSLGWTEDSVKSESVWSVPVDREERLAEIQSLKGEALNQKRAGNLAEAMATLKKAKLLEKELEAANVPSNPVDIAGGNDYVKKDMDPKLAPKSRLMIQKELLAVKKKALALRREGRLDEAEEELKKGSVLQKQLDELDNASKTKFVPETFFHQKQDLAHEHLGIYENSHVDEGEVDVTDQDLHDPSYLSLLRSLGWNEEDNKPAASSLETSKQVASDPGKITETQDADNVKVKAHRRSKAEIQRELLVLKRKALALRREGKTDEADEVLKTAKILEAQMADIDATKSFQADQNLLKKKYNNLPVESLVDDVDEDITEKDMQDPELLSVLKNLGWKDEEPTPLTIQEKPSKEAAVNPVYSAGLSVPAKNKGQIQRELLDLKRKALANRREGETEEADELLRRASILEGQIAELKASRKETIIDASRDVKFEKSKSLLYHGKHENFSDEVGTATVSAPALCAQSGMKVELLAGFGRKETKTTYSSLGSYDASIANTSQPIEDYHSLLGEQNLSSQMGVPSNFGTDEGRIHPQPSQPMNMMDLLTGDCHERSQVPAEKMGVKINSDFGFSSLAKPHPDKTEEMQEGAKPDNTLANSVQKDSSQLNQDSHRQEILAHKKKALALKREGKLTEAREELRQAKLLEKSLEQDNSPQQKTKADDAASSSQAPCFAQKENSPSNSAPKPLSGRDRFKLQQESLSHKRQALKLRREGKLQEAEAEFELAKALEAQLEESTSHESARPELVDDVVVEDLLDPQLLSALKAIGLDDAHVASQSSEKSSAKKASPEAVKSNPVKRDDAYQERIQLDERVKAEKVKAVSLKRAGKQAEALDALRRAKLYEKKLNALAST